VQDPAFIGVSHDFGWDRIHDLTGAVALLTFAGRRIDLDQLREVHAARETPHYSLDVGFESIAG
jgi:hypothetical protein